MSRYICCSTSALIPFCQCHVPPQAHCPAQHTLQDAELTAHKPSLVCSNLRQRGRCLRGNCTILPRPPGGDVMVSYVRRLLNVLIRSVYTFVVVDCYHVIMLLVWTMNATWKWKLKLSWGLMEFKLKDVGNLYSVMMYFLVLCSFPAASEGFCPSGCDCDYDNLTVNCNNASLETFPILLNPRVQRMVFSHNKIQSLSQSLVFYTELRKFDISHNMLASLGTANFKEQRNLVELKVSGNKLTSVETGSLDGLVEVRAIHFGENMISHIEEGAFRDLQNLEELNLSNNKIKSLDEDSLNALTKLLTLNLSSNKLKSIPSAGLNNLTSLSHLDLSHNHISQVPARAFASVPALACLTLSKNNISLIDAGAFVDLVQLRKLILTDNRLLQLPSVPLSILHELQELDLSGNLFESLPVDCFQGLTALQSLTVSRCPRLSRVSNEAFLSTGVLRRLVLSHNPRLSALPPSVFTSLLSLTHLDLSACGLRHLTPTQIPLQHLARLSVGGNPLDCNCSLVWLSHLIVRSLNTTTLTLDQPSCASPPALYGVLVRDLDGEQLGCEGGLGVWAVVICVSIVALGLAIIILFLLCRWWRKNKWQRRRRRDEDGKGSWEGILSPDGRLSVTRLPPTPINGDPTHYIPFSPATRLGPPPRLPPDHPLHHLHHNHHQGCLQQCPYAALHPLYRPLLHPDHSSTQTSTHTDLNTPNIYEDGASLSPSSTPLAPPLPLNDPPHWYATIGGDGGEDSGRESRPATPLDSTNSPRKVPVTYV